MNRKAQLAETMTWIVATIIIIVVLVISVFVTQIWIKNKGEIREIKIADTLTKKSFLSYLLTDENYAKLQSGEFEGVLAQKIFEGFYRKDYNWGVWLGVIENEEVIENDFFKKVSLSVVGSYGVAVANSVVEEKIKLNEMKDIKLILMEGGAEDYNKKQNEK